MNVDDSMERLALDRSPANLEAPVAFPSDRIRRYFTEVLHSRQVIKRSRQRTLIYCILVDHLTERC